MDNDNNTSRAPALLKGMTKKEYFKNYYKNNKDKYIGSNEKLKIYKQHVENYIKYECNNLMANLTDNQLRERLLWLINDDEYQLFLNISLSNIMILLHKEPTKK
jgi:hypothetical protein